MPKITSMEKLAYFIFHEILYYAVLTMNEWETMDTVDNDNGQDYFCKLF